jgi:hypothetical protein
MDNLDTSLSKLSKCKFSLFCTQKNSIQKPVTKMTHLAGNRMISNEIMGSRKNWRNFNINHRIVDFKGLRNDF